MTASTMLTLTPNLEGYNSKPWNVSSVLSQPALTVLDGAAGKLGKAERRRISRLTKSIRTSHHDCLLHMETHQTAAHCHTGGRQVRPPGGHRSEPLLTYIRVAEGVLRVRQSARAALGQLVNVQAAEDEEQADQVLVH